MTTPPDPPGMRKSPTNSEARSASAAPRPRARATSRIRASCSAGTRSGCCATAPRRSPPGWRPSTRRAIAHLAGDVHFQRRRDRPAVRGRADRAPPQRGVEVRLLYDFVGCRDTPAAFFQRMRAARRPRDRLPQVPLLAAALLGAHPPQPPQDAGVRRPHRLHGRPQHLRRVGRQADGGGGWHDAAVRSRGRRSRRSRRSSCAPGTGARPKRARLDPERAGAAPPPRGRRALAVISNSELRDRFAIRRAALHAIRESRAARLPRQPVLRPRSRRAARAAAGRPRAASTCACCLPLESDSRVLDLAARAVFGPLLAAGVAHLAEPRGRPHQGAGRRRHVRVDRQLQLRPPLARVQPRDGGQRDRSRRRRRRGRRCWTSDMAASEELTAGGVRAAGLADAPPGTARPTACGAGSERRAP